MISLSDLVTYNLEHKEKMKLYCRQFIETHSKGLTKAIKEHWKNEDNHYNIGYDFFQVESTVEYKYSKYELFKKRKKLFEDETYKSYLKSEMRKYLEKRGWEFQFVSCSTTSTLKCEKTYFYITMKISLKKKS
ncbi:hypothetical protein BPT24_275 [Tenacibaculum phage pT24]|uniref:Uncharacterized protein n=1 Tax=Tenacibaculum phage pT24 TaxID=1880590 RepID=A0A1B4XX64_9CAUD|nr:hypothetical protein HYP10_gp253 [Tenacibaculum phage pT24]BAV39392.1 hypothetical protein BPT24_275 [Tenacibaculum phage pT24]